MMHNWAKLGKIAALISLFSFEAPGYSAPNAEAQSYLDNALQLIRLHHRNSAQGNWPKIIEAARSQIGDAKATADTYPTIRNVLATLNEPHSFLVDPSSVPKGSNGASEALKDPSAAPTMPSWQLESQRFAVMMLPALNTLGDQGPKRGQEYMSAVREGLVSMDKAKICGWIIDLRQNGGGNMWPMLWGIDPLLGPSPFGAFILKDGRKEKWVRAKGNLYPTSESLPETPPAFQLKHSNAPVAVLIGPKTASSGEMTAIAFIGRNNVRVFGSPSAGFTSANKVYSLSDGAFLVLTESSVSDRSEHEYTGPIIPDEPVESEQAKPAAMKWLKKRC